MKTDIRFVITIIFLSLITLSCVPTIYNITVAPSYELINTGHHDMTVLIKDYDEVLAFVTTWAERNQGKVATCSNLRYGGIGQTSPGCVTFHFEDYKMDIQFLPAKNSTSISILGRTKSALRAKEDLNKELIAAFGQQSIVEPYTPKKKLIAIQDTMSSC